jgi:cysteine desulfurase/selenocysteine lyase
MSLALVAPAAASARPTDWSALRRDFPILDQQVHGKPLIYLDNAATSQKPRAVIDALSHYYERDNANVHRGIHELSNRATAGFEAARARTAKFLNARSADEIIFTRGTTEAINLVAATWGATNLKPGDKILLTEMEHHSNIVPWQLLAQRTGAQVVYLPVTGPEGLLDLSRLDSLLASGVKLLSMVHISNSLGTINPVADLCARARQRGIVTLVDAAQSAGHRPVNVQEIGCDFLALSGHKMCGPTGIGVLYGRMEMLADMPPYQGGGEMILTVDYDKTSFKKPPHRFEAGTPDISGPIGLHAAMDYLDAIGRDRIAAHDLELGSYAHEKLSRLKGIRLFGPRTGRAGLVSFLLEGVHAHDVVTLADQAGVALRGGHHCTQPLMKKLGVESTARASFYFYNTAEEIDRFIEVVQEIQKFFGA